MINSQDQSVFLLVRHIVPYKHSMNKYLPFSWKTTLQRDVFINKEVILFP